MLMIIQLGTQQKSVSLQEIFSIEKSISFKKNTSNILIFPSFLFKEKPNLFITNCWVVCRMFKTFLGKKIVGLKFKRRKNYRRRFGHRVIFVALQTIAFVKQL